MISIHRAFVVLAGCCLVIGSASAISLNCASIFLKPVSSSLGVGTGNLAGYITILFVSMALFLPWGERIIAKYDVRIISALASTLAALMLMLMSKFTSVYSFYLAGLVLGIANTFTMFLVGPILVNRWFRVRGGFFLGLALSFAGVGAIIFNLVGGYIIANYGWRSCYFVFGIIILTIALPSSLLLLKSHPEGDGAYGIPAENKKPAAVITGVPAPVAVKSIAFVLVCVFALCVSLMSGINGHLPAYAESKNYAVTFGATVASAAMAGNMFGKIMLGAVNDKSVPAGISTAVLCGIISFAALSLAAEWGRLLILCAAFLYGISYAACTVQVPLLVRKAFGIRDYSKIYAKAMMITSMGTGFGTMLFGFVNDMSGGYGTMFVSGVCLALTAFAAGFTALRSAAKLEHI